MPERPNFPKEEERVLQFWKEIDAFQKQLELSKDKPAFTFYDGPPFATGMPHYGHIAAGTIKDVVTRYATMTGHHVERRFGWDCHGLPIEFEIDKMHKIANSVEREAIGVKQYNEWCREIVMRFSKEWEHVIGRFGRWIDFQNDYKTMDCNYMESVWWAFKQMHDKGLVYRGTKIMPFSTACNTVLSNFEAGSNYKDVSDPSVIVSFPTVKDPSVNLIAWTTTPWTLPSNLALCVNPDLDYIKFIDNATEKIYICMKCRLDYVQKQMKIAKTTVLETFKGAEMEGTQYEPLFPFFAEEKKGTKCFSVITAAYVSTDAGTGVVHQAPGFGEDDYQVCLKKGLIDAGDAPVPIDQDGKFTAKISTYQGQYIKEADKVIIADLKASGRLMASGTIKHSYPFCWRSQTPLIYRGFDCWFIRVTDIKKDLLEENTKTQWIPSFVQEKRFHNWLVDAKDWCFSRNRYWGNPIPMWVSDDGEETVCIGSIAELEELSGVKNIKDLHREFVDNITIPSKKGKGNLKRIPEVFDCWFESGSMPFAQSHYPFSVKDEEFSKGFPANFIAEGLDQTRGWFYTLMVISTAIKNQAPFKNLIVNGIVLAEDGTKMSKSKKNYPDPMFVADQFGADACRLYLCNSPVVRAEPLKFSGEGVRNVVRDIFLPWFNAYRFLIQNITRWETRSGKQFVFDPELKYKLLNDPNSNFTDNWIIAANQNLIKYVRHEMDAYKLYNIVRPTLDFIEDLTNWYVRLNRPRMKGDDNDVQDQYNSLNTLFEVLLNATCLMSPLTPFLSEHIFQNLKNGLAENSIMNHKSIHFCQMPNYDPKLINESIEETVKRMQNAIETGRLIRDTTKISMKYPLSKVVLVDADKKALEGFKTLQKYIREELNCLDIEFRENEDEYIVYKAVAENRAMGQAFGKKFDKKAKAAIDALTSDQIRGYLKEGKLEVAGLPIVAGMLTVSKTFKPEFQKSKEWAVASSMKSSVMLDTVQTDELKSIGLAREVTNRIQRLRKTSGISIDDQIEIYYNCPNEASAVGQCVTKYSDKVFA